jgi:hypothetical protein
MNIHIVWVNKHAPRPVWLSIDRSIAVKRYVSYRYWIKVWLATPMWATRDPIAKIYKEAAKRRAAGEDVVVDHVVPLSSPIVCGLHCDENLEIIGRVPNAHKSNKWWPDMPVAQTDLFS